jgi:hypothetical protein
MKRIVEIVDKARTVPPDETGQALAGALPHLGRQHVRDRHGRADADGAAAWSVNNEVPQRADQDGNDWPLRSPGNARTEQFYFAK